MTAYQVEAAYLHADGPHPSDPPLWTIAALGGRELEYAQAHDLLLTEQLQRTELHDPHARVYLRVAPIRGAR